MLIVLVSLRRRGPRSGQGGRFGHGKRKQVLKVVADAQAQREESLEVSGSLHAQRNSVPYQQGSELFPITTSLLMAIKYGMTLDLLIK